MNFKQLKYFTIVAEEGQITSAAKRLYLGQPALSYQLRQLEEEMGARLFIRKPHGIELTQAGKKFYAYASQILLLAKNAQTELADIETGKSGTIKLGSVSSSIGVLPSQKLVAFAQVHPGLSFDIYEDNTYGILDKLEDRLLDLAIIRTPFNRTKLNSVKVLDEPMVAVSQGDLPENLNLGKLSKYPLVIYRRFENLFTETFNQAGLTPHFVVKSDDSRTAIRWSDQGLGVALVPASIAQAYAQGRVRELTIPDWHTQLELVWLKDQVLTPLMSDIIDLYRQGNGNGIMESKN